MHDTCIARAYLFTCLLFLCSSLAFSNELEFQMHIVADSIETTDSFDLHHVDLDNDQDVDVVGIDVDYLSTTLFWFENLGEMIFEYHEISDTLEETSGIDVHDLDGDGDLDIILSFPESGVVGWMEQTDGVFEYRSIAVDIGSVSDIGVGDMDVDGLPDIVALLPFELTLLVLYQTEDGEWTSYDFYADTGVFLGNCKTLHICSLNDDLYPDLLFYQEVYYRTGCLINEGYGCFQYTYIEDGGWACLRDTEPFKFGINSDTSGFACLYENRLLIYEYVADSYELVYTSAYIWFHRLLVGDMDQDNDSDILLWKFSSGSYRTAWLEQVRPDSFLLHSPVFPDENDGYRQRDAALADFDQDGDLDIFCSPLPEADIPQYRVMELQAVYHIPTPVSLLTPPDDAHITEYPVVFSWTNSIDLDPGEIPRYILRIIPSDFPDTICIEVPGESSMILSDVPEDEDCSWEVLAIDEESGLFSPPLQTFTFLAEVPEPPGSFNLSEPVHNCELSPEEAEVVFFIWEESDDPDPGTTVHYGLVIDVSCETPPIQERWSIDEYPHHIRAFHLLDSLDLEEWNAPVEVNWWVYAISDSDVVLCNEAFQFTVAPSSTIDNMDTRDIPSEFALNSVWPNPFNASVTIQLALPNNGPVSLELFNVLGERVAEIRKMTWMEAGVHDIDFNASALSGGVYFLRARFKNERYVYQRVVLLK